MDDDELTAILEDAGLSPYQAAAYVALLDLGTASATDVADACEVPDPRIYDVLRDLESKGYIETFQQGSLTARAHDPEGVLENLRSQSNRYLEAASDIEDRWDQPEISDHEVSVVKRFETVRNRARELISTAENQIQLGVDPAQFRSLRPELAAAHERGIDIKLSICTEPDEQAPGTDELAGTCTEARHREIPSPFLVLVDRTWTCFAPHHRSVNEYGVLVNDRTHTYLFYWFFRTCLWEVWETVHTVRTPEPPTTYADLRHAVREIAPLLSEGATVEARVVGHDAETEAPVDLTGTVVAVDYSGGSTDHEGQVPLAQLAGPVSLTLAVDDDVYEVGGWGTVRDPIVATSVTVTDVSSDS